MKKIIALLLAAAAFTTTYAQHGGGAGNRNDSWDVHNGNTTNRQVYADHNGGYSYSAKERDADLKKIRNDFGAQIKFVRNDRRLRPAEKERQIAQLEKQRDLRIGQVYQRYTASRDNRYDDRVANNTRRY